MTIKALYPSTLPSLSLDFANVKALDPRVTFARASTARYYNGVTTAKAEENLLLQSQNLTLSPWFLNIANSATVTANAGTAPDGTTTATACVFVAQFACQVQNLTTVSGLNYTISFFARRISGNTALHINHFQSATGDNTAFTITNDWVRYSVTVQGRTGGGTVQIGVQDRNASGFGEILIWGFQVEQRSAVTAYTPTTTQPITNYVPVLLSAANNVARFDHNPVTGESLGLLIEEQRTNLILRSEDIANASWPKVNATITANTIVAPDGTLTGDQLVSSVGTSNQQIQQLTSTTNTSAHSLSVYIKAAGFSFARVRAVEGTTFGRAVFIDVDLSTGATVRTGVAGGATLNSSSVTAVGNGWYRAAISFTLGGANTSTSSAVYLNDGTDSFTVTGDGYSGIFIWGAQLEVGAFPTSYIPTVASQVTRSADAASMTGANFSSWYRPDEGTLYAEVAYFGGLIGTAAGSNVITIDDGTTNNFMYMRTVRDPSAPQADFQVVASGVVQLDSPGLVPVVANTVYKRAIAYATNNTQEANNGSFDGALDTSFIAPVVNRFAISIGNVGLHARKIAFYPLRVTDAQLQALTQN
jgi:hypothetical protein